MFNENLNEFVNTDDFAYLTVYRDKNSSYQINVLLNNDVQILGEQGEVLQTITTIEMPSEKQSSIGGIFNFQNGQKYEVDAAPLSDDGFLKTLSVFKI